MTFADRMTSELERQNGATDSMLAKALGCRPQQVNNEAHHLENLGRLERKEDADGLIRNHLVHARPKLTVV